MLNFKNKLAKRILAFVLSGTMVFSGMTTSGMTVFASQTSEDTKEYYEEMTENTENEEDSTDEKDNGKESFDKSVEETTQNDDEQVEDSNVSDNAQTSGTKSSSSTEKEETGNPKEEEKKASDVDNKADDNFDGKYFKTTDFKGLDLTQNDSISKENVDGLIVDGSFKYWDKQHGAVASNGTVLKLNLEKKANIEILGCCFGSSTQVTASSEAGSKELKVAKAEGAVESADKRNPPIYTVLAAEGVVTLTISGGQEYIHSITVTDLTEDAKEQYCVTVTNDSHGEATADKSYSESGKTVTLTVKPSNGYLFKEWEKTPEDLTITPNESDETKFTFEMPENDVELKAIFEEDSEATYSIYVLDGYHGTASLKEGQGTGIQKDDSVTLEDVVKVTPEDGYTFEKWYVTQTSGETITDVAVSEDGKITMPANDVYVMPVFSGAAKDGYTYNFQKQTKGDRANNAQLADFGVITFDGFNDNENGHGFYAGKAGATMTLTLSDKATVVVETCVYISPSTGMTAKIGETDYEPSEKDTTEGGKEYTINTDQAGELVLTFATQNNYVHNIKVVYNKDESSEFDGKYFKTTNFKGLSGLTKGDNINNENVEGLIVDEGTFTYFDNLHGALASNGAVLKLNLEKKANIEILGCCFGNSTQVTASSSSEAGFKTLKVAKEEGAAESNDKRNPPIYTILGAEGVVTLKISGGQEYIHSITVTDLDEDAKEQYFVTVTTDGNGTATVAKPYFEAGKTVTLTVDSGSKYAFKEWEKTPANLTITPDQSDETKFTFVMPESDVTLKAIFEEVEIGPRKIDVWDFGAKEESETEKYTNNITAAKLSSVIEMHSDGDKVIITGGTNSVIDFGDLSMKYGSNDRIYADPNTIKIEGITFPALNNKYKHQYDDYTAAGGWYSNGTRSASTGYVIIDNVLAGDKIIAYIGNHSGGGSEFTFAYQGNEGTQTEIVNVDPSASNATSDDFKKFVFVAQYDGAYKIYQSANENSGKPMYNRFVRVPVVTVSGTIDTDGNAISGYGLKFINQTDKNLPDIIADVKEDGTFTAKLSAGYTYRALLTGVSGYGIVARNNADKVTTTDADAITGMTDLKFTVEPQETYTYSGTIEGFALDYDVSNLAITMVPAEGFDANNVDLSIDTTNMTFSASLEPNVKYNLEMEGANDYEIVSPAEIYKEDQTSNFTGKTITVTLKPIYNVIGGFIGLGDGVTVTSLVFTNEEDNYKYTATVADGGYSVGLRDGEYLASAVVSDSSYSTKTHVIVDGGMVSQDLFFVSSASKEDIEYVADIYVGYPKQAHNYKTVSEAVEAVERMKKNGANRGDDDRVTIHIAPGTYREQIIVNAPNITFENDTDDEVLLTWYYGVGYKYYSASGGFYNAESAYDKYSKGTPDRWGCSVRLYNATGFRAKGITFENSFNRYITDEELEDGVEVSGTESITVVRNYGTDVKSRAATERAAAIAIEQNTKNVEFYNCKFYSSQDTLYTSGGPIYFKNCLIEGQTDYIYGSGSCVFDACELSWKGYSSGGQGGYITANSPRTSGDKRAEDDLGYLFRNCIVTGNTGLPVSAGYFGRPWGAQAQVIFMNTKLQNKDMIAAEGWNKMSNVDPATTHVDFYEYNTTSLDGATVDTTKRVPTGSVLTDVSDIDVSKYFGTWVPVYYTADATGTVTFSQDPSLSDNGDINVPNPGHTLTVNYALSGDNAKNDVSTIKWFTVEDTEGTNPTLVKATTAAVDKTYKIEKAASGKYIKVEVTPETVDGRTGDAKSVILPTKIGSDYVDPSSDSNITVGDGINVYLAGDSTVKDYSAKGMWNGGSQTEDLGSWGEYLQSFFNESEVTVQNFAQGGRSSRSFINDDTTNQKKFSVIKENISEGDYLFIQFGHNDSSIAENKKDVYTPIGAKDSDGKYPYTSGEKNESGLYPDYYKYTNGSIEWINDGTEGTATYCWFLQQYIDMALEAGATPVLMTPVARMQYSADGNKKHHADEGNPNSYYWEAVKQVYEDNKAAGKNVLFIDTYELTTQLFNGAYNDGGEARGKEIMSISDGTHNNKLGGMIGAMLVAEAIQNMDTTLAYTVKTPTQVAGMTTKGKTVFSIDSSSKFTAYEQKFTGDKTNAAYTDDTFTTKSDYWTEYGNTKLANIAKKAGDLADSNVSDTVVAAPKATSEMSDDADGNTIVTVTLSCATEGAKIYYTDDGVTNPKKSDGTKADAAKEYDADKKIVLTEDTIIKAFAMAEGKTASKVVTFEISTTPNVEAPTANYETGSIVASGTVVKLETTTEGAQIRFTMGNGSKISNPTIYSPLYNKETGLTITSSTTIKAIAVKNGVASSVATFTYVVDANMKSTVSQPSANIASGSTVPLNEKITLSSSTQGASIYYTTDGTDPSATNGTLYEEAITITEEIANDDTVVIKAIAVKDGMEDSAVVTFTYTIDKNMALTTEAPVADPADGSKVKVGDTVTLSSATTGAKIIYTTDGSDPSKTSTNAELSPVSFIITEDMVHNKKVTIKAMAITDDEDRSDSEVVTIEYDVDDDDDDNNDGSDDKIKVDKDNEVIDLGSDKITVKAANVYVVNKKVSYKVSVTYTPKDKNGKEGEPQELKEDVHYKVYFTKNKEGQMSDGQTAGDQYIYIGQVSDKDGKPVETDLGIFKGTSAPVKYTLLAKNDKSKTDISKVVKGLKAEAKNMTYTGEYKTPGIDWKSEPPAKNADGEDNYKIVYRNNVNAGKASVTVLGLGDYCGSKTFTFTIKPTKLTDITWKTFTATNATFGSVTKGSTTATPITEGVNEFDYKGSPITFNGLKLETDTTKLKKTIDYTIDYKKNAQEGTATATIKGVNNYSGSIKVSYKIQIKPFEQADLDKATVVAERALQGSGVAEITINGVTLKAGVDFKPNNTLLKDTTEIKEGESVSVSVTGLGAYKKAFDRSATVSVTKIEPGKFHIKAGTVVDPAKIEKAKITDVNGKAIKATGSVISEIKRFEISDGVYSNEYISVIAVKDSGFDDTMKVPCRVATKLSSAAKQIKTAITKDFDGVNTVTLTKKEIVDHIGDKKGGQIGTLVDKDQITLLSYKNNHKTGNATVTIQATDDSPYYGTMNIKFTIKADKKVTEYNAGTEGSDTPSSGEGSDTPGSGEGSDTPSSGEGSDTPGSGEDTEPAPDPCENTHTIWLVGDSTVCEFSDNYYYPRYGYGTQIENYLDSKCTVKNLALSGRSSKSFLGEANYKTLKDGIKEGDVLVIGFGHNDEKAEADRYTDPNGDYQTEGSFAKSLYDNYVKIAQDKGAQAILCTPIVRRSTSDTLSASNCHITSDATANGKTYPGGDYPQAIRQLGEDVGVPVVDLTALTKALYESIGADETLYLHAWTSSKPGSVDNTHLNIYGAKRVAYLFANELKKKYAQEIDIARHVTNLGTVPSREADLESNSNYKEPEYDSNLKDSTLWADYGVFKGTVFGDVGGASKITTSNFTLEKAADNSMHIAAGVDGNQGKISGTADGLAMYYYKVPVGKKFSFSATAKIKSIAADNQAAFGLMARDDMYIDTYNNAISSDYVAAGSLGKGTNCFYRQNGALVSGAALTEALEAGKTYDLSIVYNGDGYECTFGNEPTQSGGFDFQLTSIDSDYVYIGMFAARSADISFSNIQLTVDGQAVDLKLP